MTTATAESRKATLAAARKATNAKVRRVKAKGLADNVSMIPRPSRIPTVRQLAVELGVGSEEHGWIALPVPAGGRRLEHAMVIGPDRGQSYHLKKGTTALSVLRLALRRVGRMRVSELACEDIQDAWDDAEEAGDGGTACFCAMFNPILEHAKAKRWLRDDPCERSRAEAP